MKKIETLHSHTITSDGKLSHRQVLEICEERKIGVVAFTDHDSLPDSKVVNILNNNRDLYTKWIIGIEVSSGWPLDLGGGPTSGLHVVGLFVDPTNRDLLTHCRKAQEARVIRMQKMVKNIRKLGFKLTENDCFKTSGGESVGRPHIVSALNFYPSNKEVYQKLIRKLKVDAKKDAVTKGLYKNLVARGEEQYPYILFLGEDSYIKGVYVDYQYYSDFDNTVKLIRKAGGLTILAHWNSCRFKMTTEYVDEVFRENRIDGAETVYGLWNFKAGKWEEQEEELKVLKNLVDKHNILHSGGADAHTVEDFDDFKNNLWFSKRTIGLTERIIKESKVDKAWSSFD